LGGFFMRHCEGFSFYKSDFKSYYRFYGVVYQFFSNAAVKKVG
jgi:hypothetical protein